MADDINFTTAAFSTVAMKPVGDEEVNALWGRKIADNTIRAVGDWATMVLGTTTSARYGSGIIDFGALGFTQIPSLDLYWLRGGTNPNGNAGYRLGSAGPGASSPFGFFWEVINGTEIVVTNWPDGASGLLVNFAGSQARYGTFIYRLRGL